MSPITFLRKRIGDWSRRRHGIDTDPTIIRWRRIYIVPTRLGCLYGLAVFVMLLGAMNYDNNLALGLASLLMALIFIAMHHCHHNLAGLKITTLPHPPVFAGQPAHFHLQLSNLAPHARYTLQVANEFYESNTVTLAGTQHTQVALSQPHTQRGWVPLQRFEVITRHPFGLFRAWAVLHMESNCLVYPRPSEHAPPPPAIAPAAGTRLQLQGDEDFFGMRAYQRSDSPRHIAWKAYARGQGLLVKQYAQSTAPACVFDWDNMPTLDTEERLSLLCRWVLDASTTGVAFGLKLPNCKIPLNTGTAHREQCLTALAVFNVA